MSEDLKKQEHVAATLPSAASIPTCPRCGFEVAKRGDVCAVCKEREDARPKPMFDLGQHKAPPERQNPDSVEAITP